MELPVNRRREIGYLCSRGHYIFQGDEDYGSCQSKRMATVYVEAEHPDSEMFSEPYEEADPETGFVWYSSSGYSESEYEQNLDEAQQSLLGKIQDWRKS